MNLSSRCKILAAKRLTGGEEAWDGFVCTKASAQVEI